MEQDRKRAVRRPELGLLRPGWDDRAGMPEPEPEPIQLDEGEDLAAGAWGMGAGWRLLRQEPTLVAWAAMGSMLGSALRLAPLVVLLMGLAVRATTLDTSSFESIAGWVMASALWLLEPTTILGLLTATLASLAGAWALGVAVDTGVMGALRGRLLAGQAPPRRLFMASLGQRFAGLLTWSFLRGATLAACGALWATSLWGAWGLLRATTGGDIAPWTHGAGAAVAALALGLIGAVGAGLTLLVALWWHLALAPLVMDDAPLGDALYESARLMLARPLELTRLYLLVCAPLVVTWGLYLPFYALALTMSGEPRLALAGTALQTALDVALTLGLALSLVWGRAGVMSWLWLRRGQLTALPPVRAAEVSPEASQEPQQGLGLGERLPARFEAVVSFEELSGGR